MTAFSNDTTLSPAPLRFEIAALTDKGMKRSGNEDAYGLFELPHTDAAFVVADGMGGLQGGDIASSETVKVMEETLRERLEAGDTPAAAFTEAFRLANNRVYAIAQEVRSAAEAARKAEEDAPTQRRDYSKQAAAPKASTPLMGATVVAGIIQGDTLTIAHAGDSRLYRLRNGELEPLTLDHSFVAERVRAGDITEAEARVSRFRNMITRAIGIDATVQPELQEEKLLPGDLLLACSDGLNTMIENEEISAILSAPGTPKQPASTERLAASLIEAANQRGGSDNITTIIVRVADPNGSHPVTETAVSKAAKSPTPTRTVESLTDRRPSNTSRPGVVDMDAARPNNNRRGSTSPFVGFLATLGVAALGTIALLAASPEARGRAAFLLSPRPATSPAGPIQSNDPSGNSIPVRDYTKLSYKESVNFGTTVFSARGDLLSYSPKAGLFFVKDTSGQMAYLSPKGETVRAIAPSFDIPPSLTDPIPRSRVFIATDLQGNSYISYSAKKVIEKYDTAGRLLLTLKGFKRPEALTVDAEGNIYVVDFNQIMKIEATEPTANTGATAPAKPKPSPTP